MATVAIRSTARRISGSLWGSYNAAQSKHPILVKTVVAGSLAGLGDAISQAITRDSNQPYDYRRSCSIITWSMLAGGPVLHGWYKVLDHILPKKTTRHVLGKVFIDQSCFAPIGLAGYFTAVDLLEGHSFAHVKENLKSQYWNGLKANYMIWPLFNLINFRFVPSDHRVLYAAVMSLVWNTILSCVKHRST